MTSPFDLSLRYKIPLWAAVLTITSAVAVSASLMVQAYNDLEKDLLDSSAALGQTLAKTLFPAMLHDNVWDAFEVIRAPLHKGPEGNLIVPEMIIVLDPRQHVFVSSHPKAIPIRTDVRRLGEPYAHLGDTLATRWDGGGDILTLYSDNAIFVAVPIAGQDLRLGTLVILYSRDVLDLRFRAVAWRGLLIGVLVLALLLPVNWYWGWRMAVPMVALARGLDDVAHGVMRDPPPGIYNFRDELGQLFGTYGLMVRVMRDKAALEQEVIRTERLAAVGRLSAGIAHEINNPLGGLLVALDTFRRRSGHDDHTVKTMAMIERGLTQIRDTVAAILVDTKIKGRDFTPQDIADVQMLLAPEVRKRSVTLAVATDLETAVALPATPVRQVLINLLLNAVQAADPSGTVRCRVEWTAAGLAIHTENTGRTIPEDMMEHLFEPFTHRNERGFGLGLWVTYQIVSQLGGQIAGDSRDGLTRFRVVLPTGEDHG